MCDTIAIVRDDCVLFAKNSDREVNEAQFLDWQPRRTYPEGSTVTCTWITIPQVPETHATLLSRPFWMWGAEMGTNEHGVAIGNEAVFTRQPYARSGLTGMDLIRLALERADTAERACDVITTLLAEHGQGGRCGLQNRRFTYHNSFIVADPTGAFVLETAGREWAIEKVQGARTISNGLTIPGFAEKHSDWLKTRVSACRARQRRTQELAETCTGVGDLLTLLRDHGAGRREPQYALLNGGMDAPCMHAGGITVASQTTASWAAELRSQRASHWVTGTSAPCTGLFKPVCVNEPLDLGPTPNDRADDRTPWWRHERLHRLVMRDPTELHPLFASQRDRIEARWLHDPPSGQTAFAKGDELLAQWTEAVASRSVKDRRPVWVRSHWARQSRRAGL
jgi:dipeptidase